MKYTDRPRMRGLIVVWALLATGATASTLDLKAKSAIIVEDRTGVVLFAKDAGSPRFPASITKILTAIVLLERTRPDELVMAPMGVELVDGASLHLKPGETLTANDLLKAILLRSANDACHALAVHIAGSDLAFAKLMNDRAKAIGCTGSNFMAPHGLHHDKHFVTARDMALITREAMRFEEIRTIVSGRKDRIDRSINKQDTLLISKNKWLDADKSAVGVKTGYTRKAGHTFVGAAERNGFRVITVILDSEDWFADQQKMVSWSYSRFVRSAPIQRGLEVGTSPVLAGEKSSVRALVPADIQYTHPKNQSPKLTVDFHPKPGLEAPIEIGQVVGSITVRDAFGWVRTTDAVAAEAMERSPWKAGMSPSWLVIGGSLGVTTLWVRKRARKISSMGRA